MNTGFGSNAGFGNTGSTGSTGNTGFGNTSGSDVSSSSGVCPTCGHNGKALEQFLGKLGISDDMINGLKSSLDNVDIDEYLNTAREYMRTGGNRAVSYAKEHPGQVAAGVAVLAVGAGMLINSLRE
ncbi:MAG TPA: hypothetical protein VJ901_21470 [Thermoanaerobaculia bacterium]|nr:hypothetical protein [Thermoanaerobaculia bacterium]